MFLACCFCSWMMGRYVFLFIIVWEKGQGGGLSRRLGDKDKGKIVAEQEIVGD